jgi:hypothetical protein
MKNQIIDQANKDFNPNVVSIDDDAINKTDLDKSKIYFYFAKQDFIDIRNTQENINFILGYHSINYQHWSINKNNRLERYEYSDKIGVDAILFGFQNLFIKNSQQAISSDFLKESDITNFFGDVPDKKGRLEILKESLNKHKLIKVNKIIDEAVDNNLIDVSTAYKIANIMPKSFGDPYLKKIQLALYEISELLQITNPRLQTDLTVSVEYQIPKVLSALGIIKYDNNLLDTISSANLIEVDSIQEKAIRGASLLACEKICQIHQIDGPYLHNLLWEQRKDFGNLKFHLTKTKRY